MSTKQAFQVYDRRDDTSGLGKGGVPRRLPLDGNGSVPTYVYPIFLQPGPRPLAVRHRDALERVDARDQRRRERTPLAKRFTRQADFWAWVQEEADAGRMDLESVRDNQTERAKLIGDVGLLKRCYIQHGRDTNDYNPKWKAITETSTGEPITLTLWKEDIEELVWPDRLSGVNEHTWAHTTDRYQPASSPPNLDIEFIYVMNSKLQLRADPLPGELQETV